MRRNTLGLLVALALGLMLPQAVLAQSTDATGDVRTFAILPEMSVPDSEDPSKIVAVGHPEGVTADRQGNVYVATFETSLDNYIYVYDRLGRLRTTLKIPAGQAPLGMVTDEKYLYVNEVLNGDILRYDLPLRSDSQPVVYDICGGFLVAFGLGKPNTEFCALNANDIGPDGRLYMSDNGAGPSFAFSDRFRNGRIFVLDLKTGAASVWFDGDTRGELNVQIAGFPEFGVNGVAFSNDGTELYMANMSSDVIYKMPLRDCTSQTGCQPGGLSVFAKGNGINGPDNIDFDSNGLLWVASGQNDRVVAINERGQIVAKIGQFEGFTRAGAPEGLLQPSGLIVSGDRVYVGNESSRGLRPKPDLLPESEWEKLRLFTVSEIGTWVVYR